MICHKAITEFVVNTNNLQSF